MKERTNEWQGGMAEEGEKWRKKMETMSKIIHTHSIIYYATLYNHTFGIIVACTLCSVKWDKCSEWFFQIEIAQKIFACVFIQFPPRWKVQRNHFFFLNTVSPFFTCVQFQMYPIDVRSYRLSLPVCFSVVYGIRITHTATPKI